MAVGEPLFAHHWSREWADQTPESHSRPGFWGFLGLRVGLHASPKPAVGVRLPPALQSQVPYGGLGCSRFSGCPISACTCSCREIQRPPRGTADPASTRPSQLNQVLSCLAAMQGAILLIAAKREGQICSDGSARLRDQRGVDPECAVPSDRRHRAVVDNRSNAVRRGRSGDLRVDHPLQLTPSLDARLHRSHRLPSLFVCRGDLGLVDAYQRSSHTYGHDG